MNSDVRRQYFIERYELTPREYDVLSLLAEALSNQSIGAKLGIRPETVEEHASDVYLKLGLKRVENGGLDKRVAATRLFLLGTIQPHYIHDMGSGH